MAKGRLCREQDQVKQKEGLVHDNQGSITGVEGANFAFKVAAITSVHRLRPNVSHTISYKDPPLPVDQVYSRQITYFY